MANSCHVIAPEQTSVKVTKVSLHQSFSRVCKQWPELWPEWKRRRFRPVIHGIADKMHKHVKANPGELLTHADIARVMRFVTGQLSYLEQITEGADRYDLDGRPAGKATAKEEAYSRKRIAEINERIARKQDKGGDREADKIRR